jgi:hypothetical protein
MDAKGWKDMSGEMARSPSGAERSGSAGRGDRDKFPEPQGWALEWDGASLSDMQNWYNRHAGDAADPGVTFE